MHNPFVFVPLYPTATIASSLRGWKLTFLLCGLLAAYGFASANDPYHTANSNAPYPPGCITLLDRQAELYGDNAVLFWRGPLLLEVVSVDPLINEALVDMRLYRIGCAEQNRSVIMVEFRLSNATDSRVVLPFFSGVTGFDPIPFELKAEPNLWGQRFHQMVFSKESIGDFADGWSDSRNFVWRYVLDQGMAPGGAEYYNSQFGLEVYRDGELVTAILVPATDELLQPNPALPLNGRLTGTWVEQGASDQGFLLTFSTPVPPGKGTANEAEDSELSVFLSWFTFDQQGNNLWLAGNAQFSQGSAEVTLPLVQVTQGRFMQDGQAQRTEVGNARLTAFSCNEIELEYDLTAAGLNSGVIRLQRLYSLEIAGYACRDYQARLSTAADASGS